MNTVVKLRPRWCLYPRGLCALCLHRHNPFMDGGER